jgi:hypothetical protein
MEAGAVALAVACTAIVLLTVPAVGAVMDMDGGGVAALDTLTATPEEGALGWPRVSVATAVNA